MTRPSLADEIRALGAHQGYRMTITDYQRGEAAENQRLAGLVELCAEMAEALEFIASGCLVPPDGGSPKPEDASDTAKDVLAKARELVERKESE